MKSRLLIINCPSKYFVYVPMGTFGLCDYLNRKGIKTKLLNLALYSEAEVDKVLKHYLDLFHPTHIGLIFHWQDTAEGFLWAGEHIKSHIGDAKIICGGFTAGYFGEDLLKKCDFLDYLIKGDPEKPLELLLNGIGSSEIPNLIYRSSSGIVSNKVSYFIDQDTLSRMSFSDLTYLYDYELYMKAIDKKLGFPVLIGRGCVFNCAYCGGSSGSFRLHSERIKPVVRSVDAVIEDLKCLKDCTKKIYLCYENDRDYIKALFRAIGKEETLIKTFQLNYGAWQLFDREFLEMYKDLFVFPAENKPVFELSPEVFDDKARKKIKHKATYSVKDLEENLGLINDHLGDSINVSIFFSRYHDVIGRYKDMRKEVLGVLRLKHALFCSNIQNVHIAYDHLSTDVASRYWQSYIEQPRDFDTLISAIRKLKTQEQYSFPLNNLCIFKPDTLSKEEIFRCELLVLILKTLEKHFYEMLHILFKCLDEEVIELIEEIVVGIYSHKPGNVFVSLDHAELLDYIRQKITGRESILDRMPFIEDLTNLNLRKAKFYRGRTVKSSYRTRRPRLNHRFISFHDHDYLDLQSFLEKLDREGSKNLKSERTAFIFLADEILSMTYDTYNSTLKEFEKGISVKEYYETMEKKGIFNPSYHKGLIARLFRNDVLY